MSNNGWMPIDSAPKDATPVDLWRRDERLTNYRWIQLSTDNGFFEAIGGGYVCVRDATHWRPLPAPPTGEDA